MVRARCADAPLARWSYGVLVRPGDRRRSAPAAPLLIVSTLTSIRPSVVGTPHRHVGPDVEDEAPRTIQLPRTAARLDGYVRALTVGSGAFMMVGLIAAQILGTG